MTRNEPSRRDFLKAATVGTTVASVAVASRPRSTAADELKPGQRQALVGIDEAFQKAVDSQRIPGVVAMAATDKGVIYESAVGYRDVASGRRMTLDTVFWIASMTKAVTATAAMQLVEQGKLQLDQPMGDLLPYL
jgi:methyl acetate hydrolase